MVLALTTFAADERTCTMRDAALPTNSITYVLCEEGLLLVTNNEGASWSQRKIPDADGLRALAFADENRGLADRTGRRHRQPPADAGRSWQKRTSSTTENLTDIQMIGDEGWISGFDGIILHTADGGKTWAKQESGVTLSIETLYFLDAQNGWAGGWAGLVLHTTDGGRKWQVVKIPGATWSLSSITFSDAKNGWISGFAGQLFRTKDGGANWEAKASGYSGWLTSIAFDGANRCWITTDDFLDDPPTAAKPGSPRPRRPSSSSTNCCAPPAPPGRSAPSAWSNRPARAWSGSESPTPSPPMPRPTPSPRVSDRPVKSPTCGLRWGVI